MTFALKDSKKNKKFKQTTKLFPENKIKLSKPTFFFFFWVYPPLHCPVPVLSSISQHPLLVMYTSWLLAPFLTCIQIPGVLKEMSDLALAATWECERRDVWGATRPPSPPPGAKASSCGLSSKRKKKKMKKEGKEKSGIRHLGWSRRLEATPPVAVTRLLQRIDAKHISPAVLPPTLPRLCCGKRCRASAQSFWHI